MTKEILLSLVYYHADNTLVLGTRTTRRTLSNLISTTLSEYRSNHAKRMYRIKPHFEEDDWEIINANSKFIPYFCLTVF